MREIRADSPFSGTRTTQLTQALPLPPIAQALPLPPITQALPLPPIADKI